MERRTAKLVQEVRAPSKQHLVRNSRKSAKASDFMLRGETGNPSYQSISVKHTLFGCAPNAAILGQQFINYTSVLTGSKSRETGGWFSFSSSQHSREPAEVVLERHGIALAVVVSNFEVNFATEGLHHIL